MVPRPRPEPRAAIRPARLPQQSRQAPPAAANDEPDGTHLPQFLLRPVRLKAR
jgi:hypothetical protein